MKIINVDKALRLCPQCGIELNFGAINTQIATTCGCCNYYEKAGSLHIVAFLSKALEEYCSLQGIKQWEYNEVHIPLSDGFAATALLPMLAHRSNFLSQESHGLHGLTGDKPLFTCIKDDSAWMKERLCIDANYETKNEALYLLTQEIIKFTAVIAESMDIVKELSMRKDTLHASTILTEKALIPILDMSPLDESEDGNEMVMS